MRLLGIGDNVVDRYLELGLMFPGGQAVNVAVAARRAGAAAGYLGALGSDRAGEAVLAALQAERLDLERLRVVSGPNAYADVKLVEGNRVFVGSSDGVSRFSLAAEDLAYAASFDIAHSSESSMLEGEIATLSRYVPISFDFSVNRDPAYFDELIPHLTVASFSASGLDLEATEALLRHAVERGAEIALATRGADEAMVCDRTGLWRQAAVPAQVVDTLGAGDAFAGRFLVGAFSGEDRRATLLAAATAAARTCESYGAFGHGTELSTRSTEEERNEPHGLRGEVTTDARLRHGLQASERE